METRPVKTAFILGAGLGTRLRPLTLHCPKPLLPVAGRPIITYGLDHLVSAGIERFVINTHHCPEVYRQTFPDGKWRERPLIFRHEPVLLETAGGLKNIEDLLADAESLLVYNGDVITDLPLLRLFEAYQKRQAEVTLVLRSSGPLMNVSLDERDELCDIRDLLGRPGRKKCQFTGIYIVERRFLDRLEAGRIESVVPVFARMILEKPGSVDHIVINEGLWCDIGTVEEYERMNDAFCRQEDNES